ncbi:Hpt domain-containing protein [Flavobacterium sp. W22_SRS_FK3]|uniref:Hpt domain-containing protein n=1 Tax=Flavobacterium sp. W22_SRS_FK3 TaxID=3240275 RepID=UPI003F91BC2B
MEQPNLNYIDQLSGDDDVFKQKMIAIIKKELPLEIDSYHKSMQEHHYKLAAECVHKLKHKISILGLEKSYYITNEYENLLLNEKPESVDKFESILQVMQSFINDL